MLAHVHGQLWNASRIAGSLGITAPTVKHYLDILEETFIVRVLRPWHTNAKKGWSKRRRCLSVTRDCCMRCCGSRRSRTSGLIRQREAPGKALSLNSFSEIFPGHGKRIITAQAPERKLIFCFMTSATGRSPWRSNYPRPLKWRRAFGLPWKTFRAKRAM